MNRRKEFYNKRFSSQGDFLDIDLSRVNHILNFVGRDKRALDIGCYNGVLSVLIRDYNNEVFGIDLSSKALELAKKKGIVGILGDCEKALPIKSRVFDVVVAAELIEHIFDTAGFLREIHRVLKKNGEVIITTPNMASLPNRLWLAIGKDLPSLEVDLEEGKSGHIRYFTKASLIVLLKKNNFRINSATSDVIIFPLVGRFFNKTYSSTRLATIFSGYGRTVICVATKI